MPVESDIGGGGIAEVVVDCPPVNALRVADRFALAGELESLGRHPDTRVVILRAEGRGFNAGVDIKEIQESEASTPWSAPTGGAARRSPRCTSARFR